MVADEPTNGELARRLDGIGQSLHDLVQRGEYAEYQRGIDHRYSEASHDIEELRLRQQKSEAEIRAWVAEELSKINARDQWRITLMVSILPTLAAILGILVTIWLRKG
jgi:hypothetical protein